MKLLLATLATRRVAFPLANVERVLLRPRLQLLPEQPRWLTGFLQLASSSIAVLDLEALFGGEVSPLSLYHPIVLIQGEIPMGLLVQRVDKICVIDPAEMRPLATGDSFQGVAAAIFPQGEDWVPLIVPKLLLAHQEQQRLRYWSDLMQTRVEQL